jgi:peptidoglycan/LPS O-acetylase OafA/YrhL
VNDANRAANNLTSFFTSLFMLNSVKFSHVSDVSWNMPSWSVSGEIIAYLLFGIVIFIIRRLDSYPRRGWVYAFIIAVCLAAFYRISGLAKLAFTFDYGFLRAILGFFSGTLCYLAYCACKPAPGRPGSSTFTFLEMCILLLTAAAVYFRSVFTSEFIYIPLFFSCILIFAFERGAVSRLLIKSPLLIESGKYSYSIYMLHTFLISIFNILFIRILKLPTSAYAYLFIPNLALIFLVSKWSYTHIELRFAKWKRKE